MILIHTALLCEAQSFIEYYKLKIVNSSIYINDDIVILISGIGKQNTISSMHDVFLNYSITKAFNIGIAGCNDTKIKIGSLYCTNQVLREIPSLPLLSKDAVTIDSLVQISTLYDMEAKYFHEISLEHLNPDNIFIFKIVSDYLSCEILPKDYIKSLISQQKIIHHFIK
tara:strand:+ start:2665 stop:3171 length:507 start_codon:yes stop_codon:yes gene_type:complete